MLLRPIRTSLGGADTATQIDFAIRACWFPEWPFLSGFLRRDHLTVHQPHCDLMDERVPLSREWVIDPLFLGQRTRAPFIALPRRASATVIRCEAEPLPELRRIGIIR